MMSIEILRGEIWLVDLNPTIGHEMNKIRPCIIIQNNLGNKMSPTTIVAPITSKNIDYLYPFEVLLWKQDSGLRKDSKVNMSQIRTVDKQRLIRIIGKVTPQIMLRINEAIRISLGLVDV